MWLFLFFAEKVAFLVYLFYERDMAALRSLEWTSLSRDRGSDGPVEKVVCPPVINSGRGPKVGPNL